MCSNLKCAQSEEVSLHKSAQVFFQELAHHFPYALLSVACALMCLSFINVFFQSGIVESTLHVHSQAHVHTTGCCHPSGMDILFHSFHFIHILFAVSGAMLTFYRYSKNIVMATLVGMSSSLVFCTLSDVLLPYLAGRFLGVDMELHLCLFSEVTNILPFLLVGTLNGLIICFITELQSQSHSLYMHFFHTFISAMACAFYAIGHGFSDFYAYFGIFFLLLLIAVVLPCTLSDIVVPIMCAKMVKRK